MARRFMPGQALNATATAAAWVVLVGMLASIVLGETGGDAHAYWAAEGYGRVADTTDAFLYTPPLLLALQPLQLLPWEAFRLLWLVGQAAVLVWLVGPILAAVLLVPGSYSPVYVDLWYGNLMVLSAGAVVAGLRNPHWLALLPFGKVLPGMVLIGAPRHVWGIVAFVTAATLLVAPHLWLAWAEAAAASASSPPANGLAGALVPRTVAALAFVGLWRLRGWRWCVPVAVGLAQPIMWFSSLAILIAWIPLFHEYRQTRRPAGESAPHAIPIEREPRVAVPVIPELPSPEPVPPR